MANALQVVTVIQWCPAVFQGDVCRLADPLQNIKYIFTGSEFNRNFRQDHTVSRDIGNLRFLQKILIVKNGIATDGNGANIFRILRSNQAVFGDLFYLENTWNPASSSILVRSINPVPLP